MNQLRKLFILFILFVLCSSEILAQQIIINSGADWKDVMLYMSNKPGREFLANTNYSTNIRISANAWTESGYPRFRRTLLDFDLSGVPAGATIANATLFLYSDPAVSTSSGWAGNSPLSGSNAVYFEKVT